MYMFTHTLQVERSAKAAVSLRMLLEMVQELTNEEAYDAEEAGLVLQP